VQALAAVLGGTQSLHTNGYDEALALPTEQAATLALRTQQIIASESGAASTADPLAGSYYVEHLTNEIERRSQQLLDRVDALGGAAKAIGASFFQDEIARSAYEHQLRVETGQTILVGVNKHTDGNDPPVIATPDYSALERDQVRRLAAVRRGRDASRVARAIENVRQASAGYLSPSNAAREPLMEPIIEAVRARASVGEIADALRAEWGTYQPG
jgi:methylmalonyl-CoA mutase, N-terminal domain